VVGQLVGDEGGFEVAGGELGDDALGVDAVSGRSARLEVDDDELAARGEARAIRAA
jgi:hypothetical protein